MGGSALTAFGATEPYTLGVEEEFQIVDPDDHGLVSRADEILGKATDYEENLRTELFQAVIETASDVCGDIEEVREEIYRLRRGLAGDVEDKGYQLAAGGTHPFADWRDQDPTDDERYQQLIENVGWPARRDLIFGLHVHVAVRNPGEAIYVNNHVRPFAPLLLALSANSPFWQGERTGLRATRTRIFDAMPRTGMPQSFANWTDFTQTLERLKAVSSIEDVTKIWWDVRPRSDLGTVEIRIADLPTNPEVSVALAALIQALVVRLSRAHEQGERPPVQHGFDVIEENRWRAIRDGVQAEFIQYDNVDGTERVPVLEALEATVDHLGDIPTELGVKDELSLLLDRAQRGHSGAERQIEVHEDEGSLQAVARDIAERTVP